MKSAKVWKKKVIAKPSIIKTFEDQDKMLWRWGYKFSRWRNSYSRLGYICLAVILIDFFLMKDGNYYPDLFLKECK